MKYFMAISFLLVLVTGSAFGEIIHVPGDCSTIQEGIREAVDGDTVLVAEGVYTGAGNRDIRFAGKAITVKSEAGAEATIIDCEGSERAIHRGFLFFRGEDSLSVVDGFTIQNGYCKNVPQAWGAGIFCRGSSPTIKNCIFSGNIAGSGGGISCGNASSPIITHCVFSGNSADVYGAGIWSDRSTPTITNCTFEGNTCYDRGSAIMCDKAAATITYCTFTNNTATNNAGGIMCRESDSIIRHCMITENSVGLIGGGIYCQFSDAIIDCCVVSDNEVTSAAPTGRSRGAGGGAMYLAHGTPTVTNCIISGNVSASLGGALRFCSSPGIITNCTIVGNTAVEGGGAAYCGVVFQLFRNCIMQGNIPEEIMAPGYKPSVDYCNISGGWNGTENIDEEPCFCPPHPVTGFTCYLRPESPCIDSGDPSIYDTIYDAHLSWPAGLANGERSDIGAYGGPGNIGWLIYPCFSDTGGWD